MGFLESLFSGARAFLREVVVPVLQVAKQVAIDTVRAVLEEIDRSKFGRAATRYIDGASRQYFNRAEDLAADPSREKSRSVPGGMEKDRPVTTIGFVRSISNEEDCARNWRPPRLRKRQLS